MSEKEKKILKRLSEIVPNLPDSKKERLLGVAEGMNIITESKVNRWKVTETGDLHLKDL